MKFLLLIRKNAAAYTCLLSIVLFSALPVQAQKFSFGIKGGTAITDCAIKSTAPIITTDSKTSVTAGLFVHYPLTKRLALRGGIDYVPKGALINKTYVDIYTYTMKETVRFAYLDFPVNLLYNVPIKEYKLFGGGGPVISYLLNQYNNKGIAGNDIGANVLVGFEWPSGTNFMVNYTQGLKNISGHRFNETSMKNYYIGITLGYWFSIRNHYE